MGVRGLQTYLDKYCPNACIPTNLKQLVQDFKDRYQTDSAEIVMNIQSLLSFLYADLDWLGGGQTKELARNTMHFVQSFESIGAKLVIFESGATTDRKLPIWVERRLQGVENVIKIFDEIEGTIPVVKTFYGQKVFIPGALTMITKFVFKNVCGCKVLTSHGECDEDIAQYARSEKCFAVLGCDTDFVIYNAAEYYIPIYHLQLGTMTAIRYDTEALASHLRIGVDNLPLLASLIGNDLISADSLEEFQLHLMYSAMPRSNAHGTKVQLTRKARIIEAIAQLVRRYPPGRAAFPYLHEITSLPKFPTSVNVAKLMESIESYQLGENGNPEAEMGAKMSVPNSFWNEILSKAETMSKDAKCDTIYTILRNLPVSMGVTLEDHRNLDLPMAARLLLSLRQRIYGILLAEKPDGPGSIEEWCICGPDSLKGADFVNPVVPPVDLHPGLLALWDEERTDIADKRWALFAHSVSPNLTGEQLRALPPILVVPAAILFYLRAHIPVVADKDSGYLEEWELKALAIQAVLVETTTLEEISAIRIEPPYNTRAIRLASIFMRAVTQMLILLAACGFPIPMEQAMPWHYFDGKLFHQTYKKILAGEKCEQLAGDKVPLFEHFCELVLQAQAE